VILFVSGAVFGVSAAGLVLVIVARRVSLPW
jgi:hypothetical protein